MSKKNGTRTSAFGTSRRESHDSAGFYGLNLYQGAPLLELNRVLSALPGAHHVPQRPHGEWANQVYCQSSIEMSQIPDASVGLVFTSPPYNVGKEYDQDYTLQEYLTLIGQVGAEVYRTLKPGGRYVINMANLGRKPYIPMHAYFYALHMGLGFLPAGEIIWQKSKGSNGSCAWGSWLSASAPRLRDVHEYLLIFVKERFERPDRGTSTISPKEFMAATLSIWDVPTASAKKVGHPAPFSEELASRVIQLFSYQEDVVLDPFNGSGTTCISAIRHGRMYVGYEINATHWENSLQRIAKEGAFAEGAVGRGEGSSPCQYTARCAQN